MTAERIYSTTEWHAEKPKGELLLRDDAGALWRVFQCYGCQSCWDYDPDAETISWDVGHLLSMTCIEPAPPQNGMSSSSAGSEKLPDD